MKKKLLVALALVLCLAVCACILVMCQNETATVSLDRTSLSIALDGDPVTLVAALSEGEGTLTWESSNPEVATVDENGTVTPVSKGTTTITVKYGRSASASCVVTVGDPQHMPVFQVDPMGVGVAVALNKGETYQIIDTVTYNGAVVDADIRYTSSNTSVATVSGAGLITGVASGSAEITVSASYLGVEIEMVVTVAVQSDISFVATTEQGVFLAKKATGTCITLIEPEKQLESAEIGVKLMYAGEDISSTAEIQWSVMEGGEAYIQLSATTGESITVSVVAPGETTVIASVVVDGVKYTVAFGVTVEEGPYEVTHTDDGRTSGTKKCDGVCDVCGEKFPVVHVDLNGNCACDYCGANLHTDADLNGVCDINARA